MNQPINDIIKNVVTVLEDRKAFDIKVLDIKEINIMTDYFIIASGNNINHIHALCDHIEDELRKRSIHCTQKEGYQAANWILMDYGNFIIHIFDKDTRYFYDLERIWKDGKEIKIEDL